MPEERSKGTTLDEARAKYGRKFRSDTLSPRITPKSFMLERIERQARTLSQPQAHNAKVTPIRKEE